MRQPRDEAPQAAVSQRGAERRVFDLDFQTEKLLEAYNKAFLRASALKSQTISHPPAFLSELEHQRWKMDQEAAMKELEPAENEILTVRGNALKLVLQMQHLIQQGGLTRDQINLVQENISALKHMMQL